MAQTQEPAKIYILLDSMNNSVPIYQRVNQQQRVQIIKRPSYMPFLQVTCQDKDGNSRNIRYKEACNTPFLDEQIEQKKIPANEKYTNTERRDPMFRDGVCRTTKASLQAYFAVYPGFDGSPYTSDDVPRKEFTLYDKGAETKVQNAETRKRLKAYNKIEELYLEQAKAMLIHLNGSFFEPPNDLLECQNLLWEFVDATNDAGLEAVLKEEANLTIDEQTSILIGMAVNAGILSFDKVEGKISKKGRDGKYAAVRDMSSEYPMEERKRLFSDFLNTNDGKALKEDIEKDVAALSDETAKPKIKK